MQQDWIRPGLMGAGLALTLAVVLFLGPRLARRLEGFQPSMAIGTVRAVASEVPVLIQVPTLTPSLTPSVTPTPTNTPTSTPVPTRTPTPTLTPTPTATPTATSTSTASPTPTRVWPTWTATRPTDTPTPLPTLPPPVLVEPEDGAPFGEDDVFKLAWQSSHTLKPDQCYLLTVRYTQNAAEVRLPVCVQQSYWWVDPALYLRADQETGRVYYWSVRLARKETDAQGEQTFVPLSPPSEERSFYWR